MSKDKLLEMIVGAQRAMYSEYMCCPWCSGHIGAGSDWHSDGCPWFAVAREAGVPPIGTDLTPVLDDGD